MTENKDVDLYEDLKKELEKPEAEETLVASDQKPKEDIETSKDNNSDSKDEPELSEEEISKLSPRAQKRIREQAEKIKELSKKEIEDKELNKEENKEKEIPEDSKPHEFKDVDEFLNAVQDKDSKKLLEAFYGVIRKETSSTLAPIEAKNNETKFETAFNRYEKIEGMADYKDDLKKTFLRDPKQDIDSLFAKVVTDLTLNKIKKVEEKPSSPNRNGKVDLDNLDLEGLYDALAKTKD
ncbi:MAG: hypothetical protein WCO07_01415 [bacterium]